MSGKWIFTADDMETMDVAMNDSGFWDDHHSIKKPKIKKRILFLGESFTIGFGVPRQSRFTEVIKESLPSTYELINMGIWGYSTDQELLLLKQKALKYSPDIVVLSLFLDDLFCTNLCSVNDGLYIKPKFVLSRDDNLELTNIPVQDNQSKILFINMVVNRINKLRNRLAVGKEFANRGWLSVFDTDYLKKGYFALPLMLLKEMNTILKMRNVKSLIVVIPYVDQMIEEQIYTSVQNYAGIPRKRLNLKLPDKVIGYFCKNEGIPVLDLLPKFKELSHKNKLFFENDLHWTQAGHSLAATEIINKMVQLGYIEK